MIHISYAEIDEEKVREVVAQTMRRLTVVNHLYSLSEQPDKEAYFDEKICPSIEAADTVLFFYSKAGSADPYLQKQYKLASDLNMPIIPVIIDTSTLNIGVLKVKSPFPFRIQPLNYNEEKDRIKLTEQLHSIYGLSKKGDVYGSFVKIVSDSSVIVRRVGEILGFAKKDKSFRIILSKGKHRLTFTSGDNDAADWIEYTVSVPDNDSNLEIHPRLLDVTHVRENKISELMYDPEISSEIDWDKSADTKVLQLLRSSQDLKKRDVAKASFYRKYIEELEPKPELKYTEYSLLPEKYIGYLCAIITFCIWGKIFLWLFTLFIYLVTVGHFNWAGRVWDWFWHDTNFWPIVWAFIIWIAYKIITWIIVFVIDKRDEIRNNMEINRVTNYNDKLYNRLNDKQVSFFKSRGWKEEPLRRIAGAYPMTRLTFNYNTLPDNSHYYDKHTSLELTYPDDAVATEVTPIRKKSFSRSILPIAVMACIAVFFMVYRFMNHTEDEVSEKGLSSVIELQNGDLSCLLPNGIMFKLVYVEGGGYRMGNSSAQAWRYEKPVHNVFLTDYYIGEFEVTQALWEAVMGTNPSKNKSSTDNPVENVSWNDCQVFIRELNKMTGQNFRLPTEAEWEFAARGGKKSRNSKYSGSSLLIDVGWYKDNSDKKTKRVGLLSPNELKIYDMSGNVAEWVSDYYDYYPKEEQHNPTGPEKGLKRVYRGGAYASGLELSRLTIRAGMAPEKSRKEVGLRLAKSKQ